MYLSTFTTSPVDTSRGCCMNRKMYYTIIINHSCNNIKYVFIGEVIIVNKYYKSIFVYNYMIPFYKSLIKCLYSAYKLLNSNQNVCQDKMNGWYLHSNSVKRSNCYMVWGGDVTNPAHTSSRSNVDLEIGCLIDLSTGLVTFTINGKEISTSYQVLNMLYSLNQTQSDYFWHEDKKPSCVW